MPGGHGRPEKPSDRICPSSLSGGISFLKRRPSGRITYRYGEPEVHRRGTFPSWFPGFPVVPLQLWRRDDSVVEPVRCKNQTNVKPAVDRRLFELGFGIPPDLRTKRENHRLLVRRKPDDAISSPNRQISDVARSVDQPGRIQCSSGRCRDGPSTANAPLRVVAVDALDRVFPDRDPTPAQYAEPIGRSHRRQRPFQFVVSSSQKAPPYRPARAVRATWTSQTTAWRAPGCKRIVSAFLNTSAASNGASRTASGR